MLTLEMLQEAQAALRGIARRTPLDPAQKLGENIYIKAENLQLTGAFKVRGAYNKIRSLSPEEAARGEAGYQVHHLHALRRSHQQGRGHQGLRRGGGAGARCV